MLRVVFTVATIISLALFLLTANIWVRSYFVTDRVQRVSSADEATMFEVRTGMGQIRALSVSYELAGESRIFLGRPGSTRRETDGPRSVALSDVGVPCEVDFDFLGFQTGGGELGLGVNTVRFQGAVVPLWFPALLTAVLPAFWITRRRRARRRRQRSEHGLCVSCGYDLRGSAPGPGKGACPECGAAGA